MAEENQQKRPATKEVVIEKLRRLAEVSKEIEKYSRAQAAALNVMQADAAKRHVDELVVRQNDLVMAIVDMHPDKAVRERFIKQGDKIEAHRDEIRNCQTSAELAEIKAQVDEDVEEWARQFQDISCALAGVVPPPANKQN